MAGFIEDFDYRDIEVKTLRDAMRYGPKDYTEDWNTAIACAQLMSEPGHDHLEIVLERCMQRVSAYAQVTEEIPE